MPYKLAEGRLVFRIALWGPEGAGKRTFFKSVCDHYQTRLYDGQLQETTLGQVKDPGQAIAFLPKLPHVGWQMHVVNSRNDVAENQQALRDADAALFMFDSDEASWGKNMTCLNDMLHFYGTSLIETNDWNATSGIIPIVTCVNKRDVPNSIPISRVREALQGASLRRAVIFETVALTMTNVVRTFIYTCRAGVLRHYQRLKYGDAGSRPAIPEPHVDQPEIPRSANPAASDRQQDAEALAALQKGLLSRDAYLRTVLHRAVDPDALKEVMNDVGIEKTIINTDSASTAQHSCFRVEAIAGAWYILCPVPFLYDEARGIEGGFAVDVDQDHFNVYAYMHNYTSHESIVLSKLPHCVHRAIALDAKDYSSVSDEVKGISNEASAIFFVNSLIADITVENDSPVEFFDDKLYLQLLNRFVKISEPRWINRAAIERKFEQIMIQFKKLDADDPFYANNKLRVFTNLVQFMLGVSDLVKSPSYVRYLEPSTIKKHEGRIRAYLESREFVDFYFGFRWYAKVYLQLLLELFKRGGIKVSAEFSGYIFDHLHERFTKENKLEKLADLTELGREADVLPIYQRAASITEAAFGPDHPTTKAFKVNIDACEKRLARQASGSKELERLFVVKMEAISHTGAERIAYDLIDVSQITAEDVDILKDGIALLQQRQDMGLGIADASTWFRLGRVLDKLECEPEAAYCYQVTVAHRPTYSLAWYNFGAQFLRNGDCGVAKRYMNIAIETNQHNPHAWDGLGHIMEQETNYALAEQYYRKSLALRQEIDANPALVETSIAPSFWEIPEKNLARVQKLLNSRLSGV